MPALCLEPPVLTHRPPSTLPARVATAVVGALACRTSSPYSASVFNAIAIIVNVNAVDQRRKLFVPAKS